jgi:Dirigent-like protein
VRIGASVGLLSVVLAALLAAGAGSARALDKPQDFDLLDVSRNVTEPVGGFDFNRAPVAGDRFAIEDDLYRWAGTKRGAHYGRVVGLGTFQSSFGADFSHAATVLFQAEAFLPRGTVFVEGFGQNKPNGPSHFTLPVIGGTGAYENARGWISVRNLGNGNSNKSNVHVHLIP